MAEMDPVARARAIAARLAATAIPFELGKRKTRWGSEDPTAEKKRKKVYIPVDKYPDINFMGLLIGPRGSNQKRMEDESGAKILIRGKGSSKDAFGEPDENDDLHVLITADSEEAIARAQASIEEILFNPQQAMKLKQEQLRKVAELKGAGVDGNEFGHYGPGSADGSQAYQMPVPRTYVGYIIGRGGETIRDLQARSGAHIQIVREEEGAAFTPDRFVSIAGTEEAVESAKKLIQNLLDERASGGGSGDDARYGGSNPDGSETLEILVPNDRVGLVIGRGGATIRSIQVRTGTNITVPQTPDATNPTMRKITVKGTMEAKDAAKNEILGLIQENNNTGSTIYMQVPNDRVGVVIGKKGETIKGIQDRNTVRVQIPQVPDVGSNPPVRTISIHGAPESLQRAKEEIDSVILQGAGQTGYDQYATDPQYPGYTQAQYEAYCQQYYQGALTNPSGDTEGANTAQSTAVADPNDPNAYWNGFYEYAAYYGIDAANAAWGVTGDAAQETADAYKKYQQSAEAAPAEANAEASDPQVGTH
uniref:Uncharacterized protein AlNc14C340G10783 n=1 Tax=Albugo laibachii Nc14 TaxID=890382 RepID=F0WX26_9STRA|nr:conserved hypothetical protein [Albugo laibachii Nc14]|eukprot:CCA26015.1 conserved hypothetical protein [Albugo laibachii Nc14]